MWDKRYSGESYADGTETNVLLREQADHLPAALRTGGHSQVARSFHPGGVFVLDAFTARQLELVTDGPPAVEMMKDLDVLRHDLIGLEFDGGQGTVREIHEGVLHDETSAVVQLVARKCMTVD